MSNSFWKKKKRFRRKCRIFTPPSKPISLHKSWCHGGRSRGLDLRKEFREKKTRDRSLLHTFSGGVGWERMLPRYPASCRQGVKLAQPYQLATCQAKQLSFWFSWEGFSGKTFIFKKQTNDKKKKKNRKKVIATLQPALPVLLSYVYLTGDFLAPQQPTHSPCLPLLKAVSSHWDIDTPSSHHTPSTHHPLTKFPQNMHNVLSPDNILFLSYVKQPACHG